MTLVTVPWECVTATLRQRWRTVWMGPKGLFTPKKTPRAHSKTRHIRTPPTFVNPTQLNGADPSCSKYASISITMLQCRYTLDSHPDNTPGWNAHNTRTHLLNPTKECQTKFFQILDQVGRLALWRQEMSLFGTLTFGEIWIIFFSNKAGPTCLWTHLQKNLPIDLNGIIILAAKKMALISSRSLSNKSKNGWCENALRPAEKKRLFFLTYMSAFQRSFHLKTL